MDGLLTGEDPELNEQRERHTDKWREQRKGWTRNDHRQQLACAK